MTVFLVKATRSLLIDGKPQTECPLLMRDGLIVMVPSQWFLSLWGGSHDTTRTYARHLKRWWVFLDGCKIDWWDALSDDGRRYRDELKLAGLANASIRPMIYAVNEFYKWAAENGYTRGQRCKLARLGRQIRVRRRKSRSHSKQAFEGILAGSPRSTPGLNLRDEIMAECGRYMGLRRQEVAGLTISLFAGLDRNKSQAVALDPNSTKGCKDRYVPLIPSLHKKIHRYINVYRAQIVQSVKGRQPSYKEPAALFLTVAGAPVSREYISSMWAEKAKAAGRPTRYHLNRRTMLTAVIRSSTKNGDQPYRLAQDVGGHTRESTTSLYDDNGGFEDGDPLDSALLDDAYAILEDRT